MERFFAVLLALRWSHYIDVCDGGMVASRVVKKIVSVLLCLGLNTCVRKYVITVGT